MVKSKSPPDEYVSQFTDWKGHVRESIDVFSARWAVDRLAAAVGFPPIARLELAIAVSELATNILKYGVRGEIELRRVDDPVAGLGIQMVALDEGPPIADLVMALRDGWGDRGPIAPSQARSGGIGAGLGAVQRLTDDLQYHPGGVRKSFRATRYLVRPVRQRV